MTSRAMIGKGNSTNKEENQRKQQLIPAPTTSFSSTHYPIKRLKGIWVVLPNVLYVGNKAGALNQAALDALNIVAVVNMAGAAFDDLFPIAFSNNLDQYDEADVDGLSCTTTSRSYLNVRVEDKPEATLPIEKCLTFIEEQKRMGAVLVHCRGAHSRSLAVCTAWLVAKHGMSLKSALDCIRTQRGLQHINSGFMIQLEVMAASQQQQETGDRDDDDYYYYSRPPATASNTNTASIQRRQRKAKRDNNRRQKMDAKCAANSLTQW